MTYEQRYGRHPDGLADLETPPEDWQFEKPIASGEIKGRKKTKTRSKKLNLAAFVPDLEEGDAKMEFINLPMDKQIKMVADEYNKGLGATKIQRILGIKGSGTYYDRLEKAKIRGLLEELGEPVPEESNKVEVGIDMFGDAASQKLAEAQRLSEEAERLRQAKTIAQAITELLGADGEDLLGQLFEKVSA
ncbi:MAG: hypothetical protein QM401_07255 [Bacillota bacterium]|nr:hypothetical protein [Bacillota bacterium]